MLPLLVLRNCVRTKMKLYYIIIVIVKTTFTDSQFKCNLKVLKIIHKIKVESIP